jgi:cell division protein FtsN
VALFGRRNKTSVPAEIQEYYQSERRERAGVAWLLAFGTLVMTIVLAAGIFFAGRWAYRTAFNNDDKPAEVAQDEEQQQPEEQPVATTQTEEERKAEEERQAEENKQREEAERQAEQEAEKKEAEKKKQEEEQAAPQQETETTEQPTTGATPQVAGSSSIPNTGPGDTAAIFAGVSVAGYAAHRLFTKRKEQ